MRAASNNPVRIYPVLMSMFCFQNVWTIEEVLAPVVDVDPRYCRNVCRLIDEGCSIPFIARYRREMTGCMGPGFHN